MSELTRIRIGSRGSRLALVQAEMVCDRLVKKNPALTGRVEIITYTTTGDRLTGPLSEAGGKGLFTKELEEALLADKIDIAVHSMKDMATTLPDGLMVAAMLEREDPRDMVVGPKSLSDLPQGAKFGTSSLRRGAQVKMLRPDLEIVPLRGNVETRIKKLEAGEVAGTMLACAGIKRLGLQVPGFILSVEEFLPAVAQGAIGIECCSDNAEMQKLLRDMDHKETLIAIDCERAFLAALDGSCRTPIAGYAQIEGDNIILKGLISKPDGSTHHASYISGHVQNAKGLGKELGEQLLAAAGPGFI